MNAGKQPRHAPTRAYGSRAVMIVDDNASIRDELVTLLNDDGYEAVPCENGLEALELLQWGLRPCVILLDLRMQVMTGWEFRAAQKANREFAAIPAVAMTTGNWKPQDTVEFTECIAKPLDLDRLRRVLLQYCGTPAGGPQNSGPRNPQGE